MLGTGHFITKLCFAMVSYIICMPNSYFNHPNSSCYYDDNPQIHRKETITMTAFWSAIASIIEAIANMGAGMASTGAGYEPSLPEELRK